jgi:hypothetical protein
MKHFRVIHHLKERNIFWVFYDMKEINKVIMTHMFNNVLYDKKKKVIVGIFFFIEKRNVFVASCSIYLIRLND